VRTLIQSTCQQCGGPCPPGRYARKFCGKRCYGDSKILLVERACEVCSKPFTAHRHKVAIGQSRTCSRSCANKLRIVPAADRLALLLLPPNERGCREYIGAIDKHGYGVFTVEGHRTTGAHQAAWRLAAGPVLPGFMVLHTCDNRRCCTTDDEGWYEVNGIARPRRGHLWTGTSADNMADMAQKGRARNGATGRLEAVAQAVPPVCE
jgi:hypothetical protein